MAQEREKYVTLYAPGGTQVEVGEARAEVLKERGYTSSKPRQPKVNNDRNRAQRRDGGSDSGDSEALTAANEEIARLREQLAAKDSGKGDGPADPKAGDGFPPPKQ